MFASLERCAGCLLPVELACRVQLSEWGGSMCVLCKVCYDVFQSVHNFMTCMCLVCTCIRRARQQRRATLSGP